MTDNFVSTHNLNLNIRMTKKLNLTGKLILTVPEAEAIYKLKS